MGTSETDPLIRMFYDHYNDRDPPQNVTKALSEHLMATQNVRFGWNSCDVEIPPKRRKIILEQLFNPDDPAGVFENFSKWIWSIGSPGVLCRELPRPIWLEILEYVLYEGYPYTSSGWKIVQKSWLSIFRELVERFRKLHCSNVSLLMKRVGQFLSIESMEVWVYISEERGIHCAYANRCSSGCPNTSTSRCSHWKVMQCVVEIVGPVPPLLQTYGGNTFEVKEEQEKEFFGLLMQVEAESYGFSPGPGGFHPITEKLLGTAQSDEEGYEKDDDASLILPRHSLIDSAMKSENMMAAFFWKL